jgi:hypothetical protein
MLLMFDLLGGLEKKRREGRFLRIDFTESSGYQKEAWRAADRGSLDLTRERLQIYKLRMSQ